MAILTVIAVQWRYYMKSNHKAIADLKRKPQLLVAILPTIVFFFFFLCVFNDYGFALFSRLPSNAAPSSVITLKR